MSVVQYFACKFYFTPRRVLISQPIGRYEKTNKFNEQTC